MTQSITRMVDGRPPCLVSRTRQRSRNRGVQLESSSPDDIEGWLRLGHSAYRVQLAAGWRTHIHTRARECATDARLPLPFLSTVTPSRVRRPEEGSSRVPAAASLRLSPSSSRSRLLFSYSDEPVRFKYTRAGPLYRGTHRFLSPTGHVHPSPRRLDPDIADRTRR